MKILTHERGRPVFFDRLRELLWPEKSPQAAANCLHTNLVYLRRALEGEEHVHRTSPHVQRVDSGYMFLPSAAWVDVDEFRVACQYGKVAICEGRLAEAAHHMEQAAALHRGDYLEEEMYEDWTAMTREWMREQYLRTLLVLAGIYLTMGRHGEAADVARTIIKRDPFREQGFRLLMVAQYFQGEKADAVFTYRKLTDLLATELQTEPARETTMLSQAIELASLGPGAILHPEYGLQPSISIER